MGGFSFDVEGLAANVQFGRAQSRLVALVTTEFQFRNAANGAFVVVRAADAIGLDDLVTLRQANAISAGLSVKDAVRAATLVNVNLAAMPANIDAVVMVAGDFFLAKAQTDPIEDGRYEYQGAGSTATRAADMPAGSDGDGATMWVTEGTINEDTSWVQTNDATVVGTDALNFVQFAIAPGVTGIASVDDAGSFASLVLSGAAPVPTVRSITNGSVITAAVSGGGNQIDLDLGAGAVSEATLAAGSTVIRQTTFTNGTATPFNIGATIPANSVVTRSSVSVTGAFTAGTTLTIGTAATPTQLQTTILNDLEATGGYEVCNLQDVGGSIVQYIGTIGGAPATGTATVYLEIRLG